MKKPDKNVGSAFYAVPLKSINKLLLLVVVILSAYSQAGAANKTWTNGAGTNNWSDAGNWSGGVPGSSDVAIFGSSHTNNCTINQQVNISGITIQTGYTGTITQASGDSIVLSSSFNQAAGTFTGGNSNINIKTTLSVTGGTFTSTTGTLFVATNFSISSGATFNHNNGTVYFDLGNATTISFPSGTLNFNNLTFNSTVGKNISTNDTMVVSGVLSLLQNQVKGGVIRMVSGSSLVQNVAFTGGTTQLEIKAALTINPTTTNFLGLILNHASAIVNAPSSAISFNAPVAILSGTFNGGSNSITMNDNFTQSGGSFTATSGTLSFDKSFTYSGGTFNTNNGTVAFTSASNGTYSASSKIGFKNVTLNKTSASVTLTLGSSDTLTSSGTLTLTKGTMNGGYMQPLGSNGLSIAAGYNGGTTAMVITAANTFTIAAGVNAPALTLDNASAIVNLTDGASPTFSGPVTILHGTFNCNASTWNMSQTLTISGGTFNASSDVISYDNPTLTISGSATFNHNNGTFSFARSTGSTTVNSGLAAVFYDLTINLSNFTPANARLIIEPGQTLVVADQLNLQAGSIDTGTVELDGNLNDLGGFNGGTGLLSITNGSGSRNIYLMSLNQPALKVDDASATVYAPSTQNLIVGGTFTLNNGDFFPDAYDMTFSSTFTQNGGNFWNGSMKETMLGDLVLNSGYFAATSDTLELDGNNVTMGASATFDHNSGIVTISSAAHGTTITNAAKLTLYSLILNLSSSTSANAILTIASGDTVVSANSLALIAGSLNTGVLEVSGDLDDEGVFNGGTGTLYFANGTGVRTLFLASPTQPNISINDNRLSLTAPTANAVVFSGTFTLTSGDFFPFAYHAYPLTFNSTFTQTGGTFWDSPEYETMLGNATISGGTFYASSDTLEFQSSHLTIASPATFNHNDGTLYFTGSINNVLSYNGGTLSLNNLSVGYAGAALRPDCPLGMAGNLNIGSSAYLDQSFSGVDVSVGGNINDLNASQGLVVGSQKVTLNGSSMQIITGTGGTESFYKLALGNTSGGVHPNNTDVYVYNQLILTPSTGAKFYTSDHNLTINSAGSISGGTANEFVVTSGSGFLRQENIGATGRSGSIVFPVGNTASVYTPVTLQNAGTNDRFDVRVGSGAWSNGTGGSPVYSGTLNQTYFVEEGTPGGSNVTLTLQWNAGDELSGFNRSNCGIRHYTGGAWVHEGTDGPAAGSGPFTSTASGITTFSPFDDGSDGGGGLPIELVNFTGDLNKEGTVDLKWATQLEINNAYFTIERSSDGENYRELARIDGIGNSTTETNYSLTDAQPLPGVGYYRLKQTDFDGNFKYEGVVAVNNNMIPTAGPNISIYPNPLVGGELHVVVGNTGLQNDNNAIIITDLSGKNIYTGALSVSNTNDISLPSNLAKGMYLVKINIGANNYQQKLMIQ